MGAVELVVLIAALTATFVAFVYEIVVNGKVVYIPFLVAFLVLVAAPLAVLIVSELKKLLRRNGG